MLVSSPAAALHTPLFDNSKSWKVGDQEPSLSLSFHHAMPVVMTNVVDTAIPPCKSDAGDGASLKSLENVSGNLSCKGGDESPSLMASILQELDKKRKAEAAVAEQSQPSPGKKSSLSSPNQEADKTNATSGQQPKHHALKRVSFGSSKGSMVETLIYDDTCPLDSKPADHVDDTGETNLEHRQRHRRSNNVFHKLNSNSLTASEIAESKFEKASLAEDGVEEAERALSKVRVTFYESQRPLVVSSPDPPSANFRNLDDPNKSCHSAAEHPIMVVGDLRDGAGFSDPMTADVGMENPFRPDGELSREADAIVERIREGKPLTPTGTAERADVCDAGGVPTSREPGPAPTAPPCESEQVSRVDAAPPSLDSPISSKSQCLSRTGANGNSSGPNQPTSVEVQRSVVGSPAQQAERVVIKKSKTKNKCCVIQ